MKANPNVNSMDEVLDSLYGAVGTQKERALGKRLMRIALGNLFTIRASKRR